MSPSERSVNAARHFRDFAVQTVGRAAKLVMVGLQEVLAHDGQFEVLSRPPGQTKVHRDVTGDIEVGQAINVAGRQIKIEVLP